MDTGVWVWWVFLVTVSGLNVIAWAWSAWTLSYRDAKSDRLRYKLRRPQVYLSLAFVLGCATRSLFPKGDVQRIVLFDSPFSSIALGRSIATVAELCFVAQWALLIREVSRRQAPITHALSRMFVPCIFVAELFSWYAVISTNYLGNAIEESLWTLCFIGITGGAVALWRLADRELRPILAAGIIAGALYTLFMVTVDVPLYVTRWLADSAAGKPVFAFADGLRHAAFHREVTGRWSDWAPEIPWMSLYFSGAVWLSIAAIHLKPLKKSTH